MSKAKNDDPAAEEATLIGPARIFRDTRYTSRTLVMGDGTTVPVLKGQATAVDDAQHDFLKAHPDLEPLSE